MKKNEDSLKALQIDNGTVQQAIGGVRRAPAGAGTGSALPRRGERVTIVHAGSRADDALGHERYVAVGPREV